MDNTKSILGIRHSEGEFNGRRFDNFIFYVGYHNDNSVECDQGIGYIFTDRVKISSSRIDDLLNSFALDDVSSLLGFTVNQVFYDQYRNAVSFDLSTNYELC